MAEDAKSFSLPQKEIAKQVLTELKVGRVVFEGPRNAAPSRNNHIIGPDSSECNRLWVLKKSFSRKTAQNR